MAKKKRLKKSGKIILDIIIVIALCVAGFSGYQLYKEISGRKQGKDSYENLLPIAVTTDSTDEDTFSVNYAELNGINSNFVGWVRMKDSTINYPFVQTTDNDYYLDHLFDGTYNTFGCIFMDTHNMSDFSDKNTILYGHNMLDGSMFAPIENFVDQSYYDSHKEIEIYTEAQDYIVYPVAGVLTDGYEAYNRTSFVDNDDFMSFVNRFVSDSTFTSEHEITAEDRIVMFSTCNYDVTEGRYVVIGKLVEKSYE